MNRLSRRFVSLAPDRSPNPAIKVGDGSSDLSQSKFRCAPIEVGFGIIRDETEGFIIVFYLW